MKTKLSLLSLTLGLGLALASVWLLGRGAVTVTAAPQRPDATVRYVDSGGTCGGQTPCYSTIQAAVDAAQAGDTIKVATGVYTGVQARPAPTGYPNPPAGGLITQVVYISETVTVRGGYTTADWNTSDPDANPTTLDAEGLGRVMVIAGNISPTVEGLRLTGGDAAGLGGDPWGWDGGGGMYVISATATITNNRVFSNTNITNGDGGGLYLYHSAATLSGNTVSSNTAEVGGGGLYLQESAATLSGNTVFTNTADFGGGLCLWHSDATLNGNTVSANTADYGGGLLLWDSAATLSGNTVSSNTAHDDGGGLELYESAATLSGNTVTANTAGQYGGGLNLDWSAATLSGNTVAANTADEYGGGLCLYKSDVTLTNTVIADNRANTAGSGLYIYDHSSPHLLHTTIVRNTGGDGSGLHVITSTVALTNTILVSHTVGITVAANSTVTLESTLWATGTAWANQTDWAGTGTINHTNDYGGDPAFVNPNAGDYHIALGSAAVDRGVNAGVTADKDGLPRPQGPAPDLGAYEVEQSALTVHKTGSGGGTVTSIPPGIACGITCTAFYAPGTVVTLTATADTGSVFAGWSGDCAGTDPDIVVTADADKTCIATFDSTAPVGGVTVPEGRPAAGWPWLALGSMVAVSVLGAAALLGRRRER